MPCFYHSGHALAQNILVHVAHRGDLDVLQLRKVIDVIRATSMQAANRHPHAIVRPEDSFRLGYESHSGRCCKPRGARYAILQETLRLKRASLAMRISPC